MDSFLNLSINHYPLIMVPWNLFLAAVPAVAAWGLHKFRVRGLTAGAAFLVWFFFFPNTAYLFTLVRHLLNHCEDYHPLYRTCLQGGWAVPFFFTYALCGLPFFIYSMDKMRQVFQSQFGRTASVLLPVVMMPFTALGLLFGLLERLNSWDVLGRPMIVLETTVRYFTDPIRFLNFMAYTLMLYVIYYGAEGLLKKRRS